MSTSATLSTVHDKRRRRTRDECAVLREQILRVLEADHPQSVRHVFYRMTDPRLPAPVEKSDRGYRHVQYQMAEMRREGVLPYGWITDATRRGYFVDTFDGKADFIEQMAGLYRSDAWRSSGHYVEVWAESRSIAGVIQSECNALGVSLYPAGGFTSMTLAFEAAEAINARVAGTGKSAEIVYIGDYDPAGVLIDRDIEAKILEHLDPDVDLTLHRIAINADQIRDMDLPTKLRKAGDRRAGFIRETVEAEAMPASVMRRLLRDKVESFLPSGALVAARAAEASEREGLRALAAAMGGRRA